MIRTCKPWTRFAVVSIAAAGLVSPVAAQPVVPVNPPPQYLARDAAVRQALQNNPALMTVRQQYGYGQAAIVIAKTYPFNPVYTGYFAQNSGPASADITSNLFLEDYISLELELRGQGGHRRAAASATATRIDWEIAQQEMAVSIAVIRAYNAVLYRQKKLEAFEEGLKLSEMTVANLRRSVDAGKLKTTDLVLPDADLRSARAQRNQVQAALASARGELRKLLGTLDDSFSVFGNLDVPLPTTDQTAFTQLALDQRPDLRARRAAICEAEAGLRLVEANRCGNPSLAPFFSYDNSRVSTIGGRISFPIPILNVRRGEIMKAQTDVAKVNSEVHQLELQASQDVLAALSRYAAASKWVAAYEKEVLPDLYQERSRTQELFTKNDPSIDLARFITVERAFLKASETLLDARFELSQAQADLALAAAEPQLALGPSQASLATPLTLPNEHRK
jgi:outer membrane protein, heavy metal efflux system